MDIGIIGEDPIIKIGKKGRKKLKNFVLCWIGWFFFLSAAVSFAGAVRRYLTGGFLGFPIELPLCVVFALFLTIWWFLVVRRRNKE